MSDRIKDAGRHLGLLRISVALAVLVAAIVLAGCGGGGSSSSGSSEAETLPSTAETTESEPAEGEAEEGETEATAFAKLEGPSGSNPAKGLSGTKVGVIVITQASEVFPQEQSAMEKAFKALGWQLDIADLQGDISKVPADVENLIQSGAKAIVLQSVEPSFVGKQALAAAKSAGVPIIGQFTGVPTEKSEGVLTAAVESNTEVPGRAEGEEIVKEFGENAQVGMIIDQLASSGKSAQKGFEAGMAGKTDVVAKHQLNYEKLVPDVTATVEQWLLQHPEIKAVWCPYDGACVGAGQAIAAAGSEVAVYSMDGTPGAFELMREGVNYTSYAQTITYANWLTADVLISVLSHRKVEPTTELEFIKVNRSNVPSGESLPEEEIYGDFEKAFEERWGVN